MVMIPPAAKFRAKECAGDGGIRGFAVLWRGRGEENRYSARSLHWSVLAAGQKIPALRFPRSILMVADRTSDNKKVSFDRAILFELFMILMQLRSMPKTKEFISKVKIICRPSSRSWLVEPDENDFPNS